MENIADDIFIPPVIIAHFIGNKPEVPPTNHLLDGQQRLSSILLFYLGVWPISFEDKTSKIYTDIEEEEEPTFPEDNDPNDKAILPSQKWDFQELQNLYEKEKSVLSLREELSKENSGYIKFENLSKRKGFDIDSESITRFLKLKGKMDKNFFNNHYLGFSFIKTVTNDYKKETVLFSQVFRSINTGGTPLSPDESRASIYWINQERKPFLQPDLINEIKIGKKGNKKIDFARYLAFVSEANQIYIHKQKKNIPEDKWVLPEKLDIARGYGRRNEFEGYIMGYVSNVVGDTTDYKHGAYSNSYLDNMQYLESTLKKIMDGKLSFNNIKELDTYLFGLIFWIIFQNKKIKEDLTQLKNELKKEVESEKAKDTKSSGRLTRIRLRLLNSIKIFKDYGIQ
jgi:Protein of unknown function DUF262.